MVGRIPVFVCFPGAPTPGASSITLQKMGKK
jgi:hypothetical protein